MNYKKEYYGIAYRDKDGKDLNGIPWLDGVYSKKGKEEGHK